ncbi:MAG TPA: type I-U CRISPR-associated helicase/endonuclease Cas3 [Polyangiales bacterium]|nr:type I-U CRISPR-associated helicase/endonuclease Cas3 [Polyangiales bacterium]
MSRVGEAQQSMDAEQARGLEWLRCALRLEKDHAPFPWQLELLSRFLRAEVVPELDIPTGLGKTATMAIWLVARALGAALPRRLVYVVDRRAVVDQATEVAESVRAWIQTERSVADALGLGDRLLPISTLRGQHVDNREWLGDPSMPAIVVGTVDMIGSRLLFEGYRCSRRLRPYHAALLGSDALIVLDEAHLVPAFEAMVRAATEDHWLKPASVQHSVVPSSRVMSLSATGRVTTNALQLGDADRAHGIVKRRLDAKKRARITEVVDVDALAEAMANKAWQLTGQGARLSRVLVFVDSRKMASEVRDRIESLARGDGSTEKVEIETELLVGERRVAERETAARRLAKLGLIAGSKTLLRHPVFVMATSAGEVGVDLDADHAVLDLVEWERMVQRLGRVNRRGDGEADVWVVPPALDAKTMEALAKEEKSRAQRMSEGDDAEDEETEEEEDDSAEVKPPKRLKQDERSRVDRWKRRQATLRALRSLPMSDEAYDASPRALTELKREKAGVIESGSTPAPLHPELTRAVVQAWSMTSLEEHTGRPDVRPWLRGWVEEEPQTTVVWRTHLPRQELAEAFFEAAAVELAETLDAESTTVLDWLAKRVKQQLAKLRQETPRAEASGGECDDDEPKSERAPLMPADVVMFVLDGRHRGYTLGELSALDKKDVFRAIACATIVVDARLGGLDDSGLLDPESETAKDVGESATARLPFRVREVESLDLAASDGDWRIEATFAGRFNDEGEPIAWLIVETNTSEQSTTADGRSTGREQRLDEHQAFAERHARGIGARVGLRPQQIELLALAAVLHDEGKKAERWQRAFRAPKEKRPLGKTTSRPIQSILAGYRHELGSLIHAERDPRVAALSSEDRDLVLHLIAAHHGFARPMLRTDACDAAPPSALVERARAIALRFARLEKRWGPWGLAWWETLLRAADQGASRENDERGGARG